MNVSKFSPVWNEQYPELCHIANGVSFMMPVVEPFVVEVVKQTPQYQQGVTLQEFCREESTHFAQHHRFNQAVKPRYKGYSFIMAMIRIVYGIVRRLPLRQQLGVVYAFESFALYSCVWAADHKEELFAKADTEAKDLFVWHFEEEYEHRMVAWDIAETMKIGTGTKLFGLFVVWTTIGLSAFLTVTSGFLHPATLRAPISALRVWKWILGFFMEVLPEMIFAALPSYTPAHVVKPDFSIRPKLSLDTTETLL